MPWHQGPDGHLLKTVCVFFCNLKRAILEDQIVCFTIWDAKISRGSQKRDVACPTRYHLSEKYVYSLGPALASLFAISVRRGGYVPRTICKFFRTFRKLFGAIYEVFRTIYKLFGTIEGYLVCFCYGTCIIFDCLVWFGLVWFDYSR